MPYAAATLFFTGAEAASAASMLSSLRMASSAGVSDAHDTMTSLRVTWHGRYDSSTRLVPSHSGYGVVTRPAIEMPPPLFSACAVTCFWPPCAGIVEFAGVFCSE